MTGDPSAPRRRRPRYTGTHPRRYEHRVFQALRIAVNEEFTALDTLLRCLSQCMNAGARVAIVSFHSGEDRRVKKAFLSGLRLGLYTATAETVVRPDAAERRANPRASAAKLRWARR